MTKRGPNQIVRQAFDRAAATHDGALQFKSAIFHWLAHAAALTTLTAAVCQVLGERAQRIQDGRGT